MRTARSFVTLFTLICAAGISAQKSGPQISVAGLRIVGNGLGANASELRAFNERPGTTIVLGIQAPRGSGIVEIDDDASRVDTFSDDKGRNLLEEARFGSFPKVSEDGSAALVEVEVRARPSAGASSLQVTGSVAMTSSNGTKATRIANVRLEPERKMKVGAATISVKSVTPGDESTEVSLALARSTMNSIRQVNFFDAKGESIESRRTGSGYMNDDAEMSFNLKGNQKLVAVEYEVWQNLKTVKVPFNLTVGLGAGGESGPAAAASPAPTPPAAAPRSSVPQIAPGPNEGAASIPAVLPKLHAAFNAGNTRELLGFIYPDDRTNFGVVIATVLAFSTMANMNDAKATEKSQKEIDALYAKHKLNMPLNRPPAEIFKNADLAAFLSDGITYLKAHMPKGKNAADAFLPAAKGLQDVKIDGDVAVGKVDNKDVTFVRVNNKWFVRVTD